MGGTGDFALPQRKYLAVLLNNRSPWEPAATRPVFRAWRLSVFSPILNPHLKACSCGSKATLGPGRECAGLNVGVGVGVGVGRGKSASSPAARLS